MFLPCDYISRSHSRSVFMTQIGDKCVKLPSPCLDGRRGWIAFLDVSVEEGTQCHRSSRSGSVLHLVEPIFVGGECLISDNSWRTDGVEIGGASSRERVCQ